MSCFKFAAKYLLNHTMMDGLAGKWRICAKKYLCHKKDYLWHMFVSGNYSH